MLSLLISKNGQGQSMEKNDQELIEHLMDRDPELKRYVDEHRDYEKLLEEFNRRPYLTAAATGLNRSWHSIGRKMCNENERGPDFFGMSETRRS